MPHDDAAPQARSTPSSPPSTSSRWRTTCSAAPRGNEGWQRVFGGQVLGQALMAAARTVDPSRPVPLAARLLPAGRRPLAAHHLRRRAHPRRRQLHDAPRQGHPARPADVLHERARSTRRSPASTIRAPCRRCRRPRNCRTRRTSSAKLIDALPESMRSYWEPRAPDRDARRRRLALLHPREETPLQHIWIRANGRLPGRSGRAPGVLAYASDFTLLDTALIAHGKLLFDADMQLASLDHALWYHRPFRADEWLLYVQDSPNAYGRAVFAAAAFSRRDGDLDRLGRPRGSDAAAALGIRAQLMCSRHHLLN